MTTAKPPSPEKLASGFLIVVLLVGIGIGGWSTVAPVVERLYFDWRAVTAEARVQGTQPFEKVVTTNENTLNLTVPRSQRRGAKVATAFQLWYTFEAPHPRTGVVTRYNVKQVVTESKYREVLAGLETVPIRYLPENPARTDLNVNPATEVDPAVLLTFIAPLPFVLLWGVLNWRSRRKRLTVQEVPPT